MAPHNHMVGQWLVVIIMAIGKLQGSANMPAQRFFADETAVHTVHSVL